MADFDRTLTAAAVFMNQLFAGIPNAPRPLKLQIDFKDKTGRDYNRDMLVMLPQGWDTPDIVKAVRLELAKEDATLSAITPVDIGRPIYVAPGILEECIIEQGSAIPTPAEMAVHMAAFGLHPWVESRCQHE